MKCARLFNRHSKKPMRNRSKKKIRVRDAREDIHCSFPDSLWGVWFVGRA